MKSFQNVSNQSGRLLHASQWTMPPSVQGHSKERIERSFVSFLSVRLLKRGWGHPAAYCLKIYYCYLRAYCTTRKRRQTRDICNHIINFDICHLTTERDIRKSMKFKATERFCFSRKRLGHRQSLCLSAFLTASPKLYTLTVWERKRFVR